MKRSIRAVLSGFAVAALLATSVTATADARGRGHVGEPGPVEIPQRYLDQEVNWAPCSFDGTVKGLYPDAPDTNCATVTVPMDWQNPDDHPDIQVAIAYSEATGDSKGLMVTNPGGPGGAGLTLSAALAISKTQLFSDYDLLGFDPRGFGRSTRLSCPIDAAELAALPVTPDYRERTKQTHEVEVAEAKLLAKACSATEFAEFVDTQQTVYDMDFLRALLDHDEMNYIGYSYGTWLGTWYADTYPERVGRFILDSNMNWVGDMYDNQTSDSLSFQRRRDQMLFPWIARNNETYGLGTTAKAVEQRYEQIRAKLVANTKAGVEGPTGYELDIAVLNPIYTNAGFPTAAEAIVELGKVADSGEVSPAARTALAAATDNRAVTPADLLADKRAEAKQSSEQIVDLGSVGTVVRCNDTPYGSNPQPYLRAADRDTRKYSYIGYFNTVPMCAFWPHQQQPRRMDLTGSPQLLMFQAEGDPATATEGALQSHFRTLRKTVFVGVPQEGQHGLYIDGPSACVEQIGDAFLFDAKATLPKDMTLCATSPLPGDSQVHDLRGPLDWVEWWMAPQPTKKKGNPMLKQARREAAGRF
ncbi:alpha/beta fold hydrolase [Propionibacteriaceae bacterium Y2011]